MLELTDKKVKTAVITNYIQGHKVKYAHNKWENMKSQQRNRNF